jgi:hypothetical protein
MTLGTLATRIMVAFTDSFSKGKEIVAVDPVSESDSSPTPQKHSSDENGSREADSQILVFCL